MGDLIPARVKVKTATTAQWATIEDTFVPLKGELIVYSDADDGDPRACLRGRDSGDRRIMIHSIKSY